LNNNPVLVRHPITVPNVRYFHSMSSLEPWVLINIDDFLLDKCTCMGINSCPHILSSTLTSKIGLYGIGRWTGISCIAMAACSPMPLWVNFSKSIADCGPPSRSARTSFMCGVWSLSSLSNIFLFLDIILQNVGGHISCYACHLYHLCLVIMLASLTVDIILNLFFFVPFVPSPQPFSIFSLS